MKRVFIGLGSGVLVFIGVFILWYNSLLQMKPVSTYEVNTHVTDQRLLIATQGSEFNDALVSDVILEIEGSEVYIKVIDAMLLSEVDRGDWDAILLIHAWQIWEPHPAVEAFVGDSFDPVTMFMVTTADNGVAHMEGIDGITGASSMAKVNADVERIVGWLKASPNLNIK
ncbi:MAG: hypothetical protein KC456_11260 [Flavobacteriales bacterium]|nr:hypothetical protein [Flavobacteriales bacterium]